MHPNSNFWTALLPQGGDWKLRREVIQAYLIRKRSSEEMDLLKADMIACLHYWTGRIKTVENELSLSENFGTRPKRLKSEDSDCLSEKATEGLKCLLKLLKCDAEHYLNMSILSYSSIIEIPEGIECNTKANLEEDLEEISTDEDYSDSDSDEPCEDDI